MADISPRLQKDLERSGCWKSEPNFYFGVLVYTGPLQCCQREVLDMLFEVRLSLVMVPGLGRKSKYESITEMFLSDSSQQLICAIVVPPGV